MMVEDGWAAEGRKLHTFFRSRGGSLRALMTSAEAEGTTETFACRFCTVSLTVTRRPFQSFLVSLARSSLTFFGERPSGPILGAREEAAPTSPPVARRKTSITEEGSNLGGILLEQGIVKFFVEYQSREEKHTSSKAAEEPESGFGRLHGEDEMQRNPIKMTLSEEPNRARTCAGEYK